MKKDFESKISEAVKRLTAGATPKGLLEEYATRLDLHEAFFVVTQAQIRSKKNK